MRVFLCAVDKFSVMHTESSSDCAAPAPEPSVFYFLWPLLLI